jgi:hypothetical protein
MSKNGASGPNFKNYNSSQLEKFSAIKKAKDDNHIHLAATLIMDLAPKDEKKYDEYMAEWELFYQTDIFNAENKEIIHQYKPESIPVLSQFNSQSNGHVVTKIKKEKKKMGSCSLF